MGTIGEPPVTYGEQSPGISPEDNTEHNMDKGQ